jgi:hypothetical protein
MFIHLTKKEKNFIIQVLHDEQRYIIDSIREDKDDVELLSMIGNILRKLNEMEE